MIFGAYMGGWALFRLWALMGWRYGAVVAKSGLGFGDYFRRFGPLLVRDAIIQGVLFLAWASGALDKGLTVAFSAAGMTVPEIVNPTVACLVGFIVAFGLSDVLVKHMPVGDFAEPPEPKP